VDDVAADPRSVAHIAAYQAIETRGMMCLPLVRAGRLETFLCIMAPQPRAWTHDDVAVAQDVAARTWSALVRARSEQALRESEARFRAIANSAPLPIWVTSAAGPVDFVNSAFCRLAGMPEEALVGNGWFSILHPDDGAAAGAARDAGRRALATYEWEARFRRFDGEWRWMHATSQPRFDATGAFQGYVGLAVDVTETRRSEERHRLLINELNHRVKNTLATVQSLARQTLRERAITLEARDRLTDRLLALSAAHNVLTRQNWEAAELGEIVAEAVRPYADAGSPRFEIEGPPVRLAPNAALAVSMALHELATNAVKYGALSARGGRISIAWTLEEGIVALEWRERGGPPVSEPQERGFGSRLLSQGLTTELGAPAEVLFEPAGLICRLRAPAAA